MPRNGSGTFIPPSNSWNPQVNGALATAADFAAQLTDLSNALTQSISADGQTPVVGSLNMNNNKLVNMAAGTATGDSLRWEQLFSQGLETVLASSATTDIGAQNTCFINITGTTTITSLGTNYNGPRYLRFSSALTITNNSTSLICPFGANASVKAGDIWIANPKTTAGVADGWWVIRLSGNTVSGASKIYGLTGESDATTPTTKFNLRADVVITQANSYSNVTTRTVDISLASQVGGRDQAAPFSAFAEINLFFVPDGSGGLGVVASLASANTGPTGYSEWAIAANLKLNGSSQILQGNITGSVFYFSSAQSLASASTAAFPTPLSTNTAVPAVALSYTVSYLAVLAVTGASQAFMAGCVGYSATQGVRNPTMYAPGNNTNSMYYEINLPQTAARTLYFGYSVLGGGAASVAQYISIASYTMRTGAT